MSTVLPAPASAPSPGHRLVPARIGTWRRNQIAYISCPSWCSMDHTADPCALEDITHYGDLAGVLVPTLADPDTALFEWYTRVSSDPVSDDPRFRSAHVLVGDGSADEARMTPKMAEEFADDLIRFASQVRTAARIARDAT